MSRVQALALAALAASLGCFAGCGTPTGGTGPVTSAQLRGFFSRAQDPRRLWLTAYPDESGGAIFANAFRLHPEQVVARQLLVSKPPISPVLLLEAGLGDRFAGVLDTTTGRSWMEFDTALSVRAIPLGPPAYEYTPLHVNDAVPGYLGVLSKLRIGDAHVESALFAVRAARGNLGHLSRGITHPPISCVLGTDLIKAFEFVQVDFPNRRVVLSSTSGYSPEDAILVAAVPLEEVDGAFAADGVFDGKPARVVLDLAGDFEAARPDAPAAPLRQVSVGDVVFRQVRVADARKLALGLPDHPRVGRQLLSRFKVTFAPKQNLVYFERPGPVR